MEVTEVPEKVLEIMRPFELQTSDYADIMAHLNESMTKGLGAATHAESDVKMFPSYVTKLPTGKEEGRCLALDLGGTNYRVILVTLASGSKPQISETTYAIPHEKMVGTGVELFDYIARTLYDFLKSHSLADAELPLGFTFSFPCDQRGLNQGVLVRWTKGFAASGVQGKNVAQMLQDAIVRTNLKVKCVAVLNDTVGTLTSCALQDPKCGIGLIVGTGTNAAYLERIDRVELYQRSSEAQGDTKDSSQEVIINMEWGAFGEGGALDCYLTKFDRQLDAESLQPRKQIFEKMISGMYLGELVRHVLVHLVEQKILFRGEMPNVLTQRDSFHTKYITETERDPPHLFYSTHYMLTEDLLVPIVEPVDDRIVRYVCEKVSERAAFLAGSGVACLLNRMRRSEVTIGVDGSLYKFHPRFRERMTDIIDRLKEKEIQFRLRLSEDGSGKGAAAIAAATWYRAHRSDGTV